MVRAMPLLKIVSSHSPHPEVQRSMLGTLSKRLAELLGKPESYVMTCWAPNAMMTFGGTDEASCFVEVKNIGRLTSEQTNAITRDVCNALAGAAGVAPNRTYVEFEDAEPHLWGWNGENFA